MPLETIACNRRQDKCHEERLDVCLWRLYCVCRHQVKGLVFCLLGLAQPTAVTRGAVFSLAVPSGKKGVMTCAAWRHCNCPAIAEGRVDEQRTKARRARLMITLPASKSSRIIRSILSCCSIVGTTYRCVLHRAEPTRAITVQACRVSDPIRCMARPTPRQAQDDAGFELSSNDYGVSFAALATLIDLCHYHIQENGDRSYL